MSDAVDLAISEILSQMIAVTLVGMALLLVYSVLATMRRVRRMLLSAPGDEAAPNAFEDPNFDYTWGGTVHPDSARLAAEQRWEERREAVEVYWDVRDEQPMSAADVAEFEASFVGDRGPVVNVAARIAAARAAGTYEEESWSDSEFEDIKADYGGDEGMSAALSAGAFGPVVNVAANLAALRESGALMDDDFQDTEPEARTTNDGSIRMPVLGKGWGA